MKKQALLICSLPLALSVMVGCSSTQTTQATPAESITPEVTAAASPSGTSAPETTNTLAPAPAANGEIDKTAELKAANPEAGWLDQVTAAVETEPGRIRVETTVVDPKGEDGSPAAQAAIQICEATMTSFDPAYTHIYVMEEDGTHFVLYGHPAVPEGTCTEV